MRTGSPGQHRAWDVSSTGPRITLRYSLLGRWHYASSVVVGWTGGASHVKPSSRPFKPSFKPSSRPFNHHVIQQQATSRV